MARSYLSRASLAEELDISESTVDALVRKGVLPKPSRLSSGCVRWSWAAVEAAIASLDPSTEHGPREDPFISGARNAAQAAKEGRRGTA